MTTKVVQNRLRRVARRQGYILHRSRVRDPRAVSYDRFRLEGHTSFTDPDHWATWAQIARMLREPLAGGPKESYARGFGK